MFITCHKNNLMSNLKNYKKFDKAMKFAKKKAKN